MLRQVMSFLPHDFSFFVSFTINICRDGLTALHCAASRGHTECIDTLISLCGAPTDLIGTVNSHPMFKCRSTYCFFRFQWLYSFALRCDAWSCRRNIGSARFGSRSESPGSERTNASALWLRKRTIRNGAYVERTKGEHVAAECERRLTDTRSCFVGTARAGRMVAGTETTTG